MRDPRPGRPPLWLLGLALGLVWAFWALRDAFFPFFVAVVLAYLLLPVVTWLERWMRRSWAVLVVVTVAGGLFVGLLWILLPWLWDQGTNLMGNLPAWRKALEARWGPGSSVTPGSPRNFGKAWLPSIPWCSLQACGRRGSGCSRVSYEPFP